MKLSEAIRLGAMLKPQGFGGYFVYGKTCAMGAALDAIGQLRTTYGHSADAPEVDFRHYRLALNAAFPLLAMEPVACPRCGFATRGLVEAIQHLNDAPHRWTREQIADWVETIEQQQAAADRDGGAAQSRVDQRDPVTVGAQK